MPGFELIDNEEKNAVINIFDNGAVFFRHGFDHLRNNIYEVNNFESNFSKYIGNDYSLGVTSGTAALRLALAAINIKPGDEVITQSFTFVATIEAIVESGAIPVVADVNENLDMDISDLENKITNKTKCIIPVHMLGGPANMEKINLIAKKYNIFVIEDVAWRLGGAINEKKLGSWGDIGAFSFDHAKAMTTGEGGMLTFKDKKLFEKAKAWHDHGHENNPNLPRWEDSRTSSGFNFRMNEIQGAIGNVQLKKLDNLINFQIKKKKKLSAIVESHGFKIRKYSNNYTETVDSFIFFADDTNSALKIKKFFETKGVATKILPEAISWHFAGDFNHIESLVSRYGSNLREAFNLSYKNISKAISLPIMLNDNNLEDKLAKSLDEFFGK